MRPWPSSRLLSLTVVFLAAACTGGKHGARKDDTVCHKRYGDLVGYLRHFKNANVLPIDVAVPPAEGSPKPLAFDAKRRVLQCDPGHCWLGSAKVPYGPRFEAQLAETLKASGHGKCGSIYLAMTDTLPAAKAGQVLQGVGKAGCAAHAVVRTSLSGLPPVEPTEALRQSLKSITKAGSLSAHSLAAADIVSTIERQHHNSCQDVGRLMQRLKGTSGYRQYELTMEQLQRSSRSYESCVCSLPGEDEKIVFQLVATRHLSYELFVYGAKPIPAPLLAGKLPAGKMWNDVVQAMK